MTRKVRQNKWNRDRSEMRAGRRQKLSGKKQAGAKLNMPA
jgi:hypothetical protein